MRKYTYNSIQESKLIVSVCKKNMIPAFITSFLLGLASYLGALIAGRFIGVRALAAIALLAPFDGLAVITQNILITGSTSIYIRYKSQGKTKQANRAFGAILIFQAVFFCLFFLLLGLCSPFILHLFTGDEELIADALAYYFPIILGEPLSMFCLCLERGFKSDGKIGFFGVRGIIFVVANLIFELIALCVFNAGMKGIGIAEISASLLGYLWSVSYIFRQECSIRPDVSIIKNFREMKGYLIEDIKVGGVFAIDDLLSMFADTVATKIILTVGGTSALACYGIFKPMSEFFEKLCNSIRNSFYQLSEMFHSNLDTVGLKTVFKLTLFIESFISLCFLLLCILFPLQIGSFFSSDVTQIKEMLIHVIRICCFGSAASCFSNTLSSFLLACKKPRYANRFNIVNNIGVTSGIALGGIFFGFYGLIIGKTLFSAVILLFEAYTVHRLWKELMPKESTCLSSYSYSLADKEYIGKIYDSIHTLFHSHKDLHASEMYASLLIEEFNYLLEQKNEKNINRVLVNLKVKTSEENFCLIFMDNGMVFDPQIYLKETDDPKLNIISAKILSHLSPDANYSRVLDMNISRLFFYMKGNSQN